jgi:hypothetical protein
MRQYFNEFNATNEQEIGRAMLDGVSALRESLGQIEDSSVVVFSISENRQLRRSQKYRRTPEGLVRNDNSIPARNSSFTNQRVDFEHACYLGYILSYRLTATPPAHCSRHELSCRCSWGYCIPAVSSMSAAAEAAGYWHSEKTEYWNYWE